MSSDVRLDIGGASVLRLCHGTGFGASYRSFSIHMPFVVVGVVVLPDAISVSLLQTHKLCVANVSTSKNAVGVIFVEWWSMLRMCSFG